MLFSTRNVSILGGLKRFAQVSPVLYRGSVPDHEDLFLLKQKGIKSIVDFQISPNRDERRRAEELGLKYVHIPWTAHLHKAFFYHYILKVSVQFLDVFSDPEHLPVYVHCYHGRERTGTMIAVYRISVDGWSYQSAREEMLSYGVNELLHFNLFIFLKRYDEALKKQR